MALEFITLKLFIAYLTCHFFVSVWFFTRAGYIFIRAGYIISRQIFFNFFESKINCNNIRFDKNIFILFLIEFKMLFKFFGDFITLYFFYFWFFSFFFKICFILRKNLPFFFEFWNRYSFWKLTIFLSNFHELVRSLMFLAFVTPKLFLTYCTSDYFSFSNFLIFHQTGRFLTQTGHPI